MIEANRFKLSNGTLYLHYEAFISTLELLCSEEQAAYWVPLAKNMKVVGCYAQTELGHGSDV